MTLRKIQLTLLIYVMSASFAWAGPDLWHSEWDSSAAMPDAQVTTGTDDQGNETRNILLPGKIKIYETRHGDKQQTVAEDISGKGAVMCAWGLYAMLRSYFDLCPTDASDNDVKTALDNAIDRIDDFIVANSNTGVTKEVLQNRIEKDLLKTKKEISGLSEEARAQKCSTGQTGKIGKGLKSMTPEKMKADIDELLSVPRPPVINPCL